jgi:1,4-alpha-glucan branching enzyme
MRGSRFIGRVSSQRAGVTRGVSVSSGKGDPRSDGRMIDNEADGSMSFLLHQPGARRVELVGAFDNWHEQRVPMSRGVDGRWRPRIHPGLGEYLFRCRVDDERWVLDESSHGTFVTAAGKEKRRVWCPPPHQDPDRLAA